MSKAGLKPSIECWPDDEIEIKEGIKKFYKSCTYQEKQQYFGKGPLNADEFFNQMEKMFEEAIQEEGLIKIEPKDNGVRFSYISPDGKMVIPPVTSYRDLVGGRESGPNIYIPLNNLAVTAEIQNSPLEDMLNTARTNYFQKYTHIKL